MRYLFAAIIFCGVGVAGAQELPSANFAPVALSEQRTQVWRVYNLNPDCTPADAIVGKVTKQGKGQVEFEENLGFSTYPPNTQKSRCNAQLELISQSRPVLRLPARGIEPAAGGSTAC